MDIRINDILTMKKPHPCGESHFLVRRMGIDLKLQCTGCGREFLLPRIKAEKQVKTIQRKEEN